jgi:PadR family transcriptional regulator, regulatory protein PadR
MAKGKAKTALVQGTLDMLVLRTLGAGPLHGYAIARSIQRTSNGVLTVEEGSLYPALHRMQRRGWIEAEWGLSEANRKAKYYRLTEAGRARLRVEVKEWKRLTEAIGGVVGSRPTEAV